MASRSSSLPTSGRGVLAAPGVRPALAVLLGVGWVVLFVLTPSVGYVGDFYPLIHAARLVAEGRDPYTDAAVRELVQLWPSPYARSGFAYPLPLAYLLLPLTLVPLPVAVTLWLGAGVACVVYLMRRGGRDRMLLPLLSVPLLDALAARQMSLLWLGLIVVMVHSLNAKRWPWVVGLSIALLPIKPQIGLLFAIYGLVYGWQHQRRAVVWAVGWGLLIWGGTLLLRPDWPVAWISMLSRYRDANPAPSLLPWSLALVLVTWHLRWPSRLAALQVALFPLNAVYTLAPLVIVWLELAERPGATRRVALAMALGFLYLPLRAQGSAALVWLLMGVPLIVVAYLDRRAHRANVARYAMLRSH